jgi:hypothetical protein
MALRSGLSLQARPRSPSSSPWSDRMTTSEFFKYPFSSRIEKISRIIASACRIPLSSWSHSRSRSFYQGKAKSVGVQTIAAT